MLEFLSKEQCSGCSACASVCPKSCIDMVPDSDGFLYPHIVTDNCIKCHLCEKVCPVLHKPTFKHIEPVAGAMRTLDVKVWKNSASVVRFMNCVNSFWNVILTMA